MTEYQGPSQEDYYQSKFVRVGENIYTTPPGNKEIEHIALARQDGITEEIAAQRLSDPKLVDAGIVTVVRDLPKFGGWQIMISGSSVRLALPLIEEARDISVTVFEAKSPGFSVKKV